MLIIKNFTNWLNESAGLVTEVTTPAAVKTLAKDISAATKFNKWTVSKTYPAVMFKPNWIKDSDKTPDFWRIAIDAYEFVASPSKANILAKPYMEELMTNIKIASNPEPTTLPSGTKVDSPALGVMPQVTTQSNPWGLNAVPSGASIDAYAAYDQIAKQDPEVTVDIYLGILNAAVANASDIMKNHITSGLNIGGYPANTLKGNLPLAQDLVDKVKTLVPAVPAAQVVKPV